MSWFRLFATVLLAVLALSPARAELSLPPLSGPAILTLSGLDPQVHDGGSILLDRDRLEALGATEIETTSIWTDGLHRYRGVPLHTIIQNFGLAAHNLRLHALNDYSVDFPAAEALPGAPILAYEMDGAPMSVREKGPIWVIYPYDSDASFRTDTIFSRSIWQLDRIDVLR